jgi:hypothetical protein
MFVAFFFLIDRLLYIIIPPSSIFRFTFISSDYSKHLYSQLPHVSQHLIPHTICIFTYILRSFCNNSILKHLKNAHFELLLFRSHNFRTSISSDTYLKNESQPPKACVVDDTLNMYNLTIHAVWSLLPFSKNKIDLARVLVTVKSN